MNADTEFRFPPDFLLYPHYGSVIHPPPALPAASATQPPHQKSSPPAMKAFTVNSIGRWSEQPAASSSLSAEVVQREPVWRGQPPAEIVAQPQMTPIDAVLGNQAAQLVRLLNDPVIVATIDAEDDSGRSALDHALERRNFPLARLLVRQGAKVADDMALDAGLLSDMIAAGEMHLALEVAKLRRHLIGNGDNDMPQAMQRWQAPLFKAIVAGNVDLVRQLADPQTLALRDRLGGNALHFAAHSPDPLMLASLLARLPNEARHRAQILDAVRTDGRTPLVQAVIAGRPTAVTALLRAGAYVDAVDHCGDTALHKSAAAGHLEIARLLLVAGARTDIRNSSGQDPAATAGKNGRPEITQLLQAFSVQD